MEALRQILIDSLKGGQAHATFEDAVKDFPATLRGKRPPAASHTAWQLLEHLRIAQHDILEFSRNAKHVSPKWPEGYWPAEPAPASEKAWDESVASFEKDHKEFLKLVEDPSNDLIAKFPHGDGQTLLREALLIIDHNAYHIGQLVMLRVQLGAWGL
jgi:uncharacterized damage-inducible protein DinB